jgi:hypothetical protein
MTQEQQKLTIEYRLGRSEMKNEILEFLTKMDDSTVEDPIDGSEFSKNKNAILATLRSIHSVVSKSIKA